MATAGRLRAGRGQNEFVIANETETLVRDLLEEGMPGVLGLLEDQAREVYDLAQQRWPVKTGRSKRAMTWSVRFPRGDLSVMQSFVGFERGHEGSTYAHLIKGRQDGGKQSWRVHLFAPFEARTVQLTEAVGERLMAALGGEGV